MKRATVNRLSRKLDTIANDRGEYLLVTFTRLEGLTEVPWFYEVQVDFVRAASFREEQHAIDWIPDGAEVSRTKLICLGDIRATAPPVREQLPELRDAPEGWLYADYCQRQGKQA